MFYCIKYKVPLLQSNNVFSNNSPAVLGMLCAFVSSLDGCYTYSDTIVNTNADEISIGFLAFAPKPRWMNLPPFFRSKFWSGTGCQGGFNHCCYFNLSSWTPVAHLLLPLTVLLQTWTNTDITIKSIK